MGADQATILAGLDDDAYALFKQQREEVKVEASENTDASENTETSEDEEVTEAGKLTGSVLSTTEKADNPLTLQNMGDFLSSKVKGGK